MPLFKLGKAKLPHRKSSRALESVRMPAPASVTIPMSQHIGAACTPTVKVGDAVCVGTVIGDSDAHVSAPIHSSVSGVVKKIDNFLLSSGKSCLAVTIESDGQMTPATEIAPVEVNSFEDFVQAVRDSGAVGLGGAGFPTSVKLSAAASGKIEKIIVNGAECEPYITSDTRTMIEDTELVKAGLLRILSLSGVPSAIIGIEKDNKLSIKAMTEAFSDDERVEISILPASYPQGAEKVLVYNTTGKVVPEGELPASVGVIVLNVTTIAFIEKYIRTGMPLVEKRVTVAGSAIKTEKNVIVPIGTSVSEVVEFAGGVSEEPKKILFGGPMMGVAMYTKETPIIKNCNAVVLLNEKDTNTGKTTACIHCGACLAACPFGLNPVAYAKALGLSDREERAKRLMEDRVNICMECGCCSFVCPAKRPLVTNNKLAKADLRAYCEAKAKREEGKE